MLRKILTRISPDLALRLPVLPDVQKRKRKTFGQRLKEIFWPERMKIDDGKPKMIKVDPRLSKAEKEALKAEQRALQKAEQIQAAKDRELQLMANKFVGAMMKVFDSRGLYHVPAKTADGRAGRKQHVKFYEPIRYNSDYVYVRVNTDDLPYGVTIEKLEDAAVLRQIGQSINVKRKVTTLDSERAGLVFVLHVNVDSSGIPRMVTYDEMLKSRPMKYSKDNYAYPIGMKMYRESEWASFVQGQSPHILIFGTTGSGKSNTEHMIIASLAQHNTPEQVQFILFDYKRVELTWWKKAKHVFRVPYSRDESDEADVDDEPDLPEDDFLPPVITNAAQGLKAFRWIFREINRRMRTLEKHGYRDVIAYNAAHTSEKSMVPFVIVVDEMATLFDDTRFNSDLTRLLTKCMNLGRAAGFWFVVFTQTANAANVPQGIRQNFGLRLALKSDKGLSILYLDDDRAASISTPGRAYFKLGDQVHEVQVPFMSDGVLKKIIRNAELGVHTLVDTSTIDIDTNIADWAVKRNNLRLDRVSMLDQWGEVLSKAQCADWPKTHAGHTYNIEGQWYKVSQGSKGRPSMMVPIDAPADAVVVQEPIEETVSV
jgi:hypothetical protein